MRSLGGKLLVKLKENIIIKGASQVEPVIKNPPASVGDIRDVGLIPGSIKSPGGAHGKQHQYSRLENPMDGGVW